MKQMSYNFDKIIDRRNTASVKYDLRNLIFGNPEVIPMWVADMDFETPDFIREAVIARAMHPVYGYSFRTDDYYQSIISWMNSRHDWNIEKDWILFSPGVVPALNIAVLALTNPGDEVIVQPPVYFPFFSAVKEHNRAIVYNQLILKDGKYQMNFDQLRAQAKTAKMLILCNPHNPVGRAWSRFELEQLAEICVDSNLLVISDEIHSDLVLPQFKHTVFSKVNPQLEDLIITMHAASKTFNIAGLASSSVIIKDKTMREQYNRLLSGLHVDMGNMFGFVATQAAFEKGELWLSELLRYVSNNIDFAISYFEQYLPKVKVIAPEATYMIWLDFSAFHLTDSELKAFLVDKAGVGLNSGIDFGPGGEGFMRMNVACPKSTLHQSLEQIRNAMTELFDDLNV